MGYGVVYKVVPTGQFPFTLLSQFESYTGSPVAAHPCGPLVPNFGPLCGVTQTGGLTRGTVFSYGVDGVCHQLANQVLYATGSGGAPLTMARARGYMASTFIYGTYGLQHAAWANKLASCGRAGAVHVYAYGGRAVALWWNKARERLDALPRLSVSGSIVTLNRSPLSAALSATPHGLR